MKTTLLTFAITLFLFSCHQTDDDILDHISEKKTTVYFKPTIKGLNAIKLTNARTDDIKDSHTLSLTVKQGNTVIIDNFETSSVPELNFELPYGDYTAEITKYETIAPHQGKVEAEGSVDFTVNMDLIDKVEVLLEAKYMLINMTLTDFEFEPGESAKVWIGPEGFTPSDEYIMQQKQYIETANFDIVMEYGGETKRFTAPTKPNTEYYITIVNKPDEPTESAHVQFAYDVLLEEQYITFEF